MQFNIDLLNNCCLSCPTCAVGAIGGRTGKPMTIDLFRRILDKAQREVKVRRIQLYAYTDPCLHKDLHLFVAECTDRGIESTLSTMLQTTKCDFAKVIEARPTEFRISFPGWKKMHVYQRGAAPSMFDAKFARVSLLPRHPETKWTMAYHLYNDNADEMPAAKQLAQSANIHFVALPAIFMVNEKVVEKTYTKDDLSIISHLIETPESAIAKMKVDPTFCILWKQVTIDAEGMVYLCQLVYEKRFQIVPFLDVPLKEISRRIKTHSFCGDCMKAGGHVYQECYADFVTNDDPIAVANRKRMK
jgi:hypothetical protein